MATRRYRSKAEWRRLVEEHKQSGLNASTFCKQQGLSRKSFYRNRKALQQITENTASRGSFVQVVPCWTGQDRLINEPIEFAYRESRLRLPPDTDPLWLARLLKALT